MRHASHLQKFLDMFRQAQDEHALTDLEVAQGASEALAYWLEIYIAEPETGE